MEMSTRRLTSVVAAVGLIGFGFGAGSAAAEVANGGNAPVRQVYRSCDFSVAKYVDASGFGDGNATITASGGAVTANVFLAVGRPNTPYQVRLIQGPRPGSQRCNAGDPGVASAVLNTDGNGTGTLTLNAPLQSGATNAWVFIEGPPDPGEIRGEFYTSEVLTSLK